MPTEVIDPVVEKYGETAVLRAAQYGQTIEYSFTEMLYGVSSVIAQTDGKTIQKTLLPGIHLGSIGSDGSARFGPAPSRIMMIGAWPCIAENEDKRLFKGKWVAEFNDLMEKLNFPVQDIYFTTYVKHFVEGKFASIPKEMVLDYGPLLKRELELVKPELVIVLGAKALKAVVGSNKATMEHYKNRTVPADESPLGVKMAAITDFAAILHAPENRGAIAMDLARIANELGSNTSKVADETKEDYTYVYGLSEFKQQLQRIESEYTGWLAVDCEWGGDNFLVGELRCIQFGWAPGKALVAVFNKAGMQPTELMQNKAEAWAAIKALVENGRTKLIGHFIRADLPWMQHNGVNISLPAMTGWDTALAGHLLDENWAQGLEVYTARHTQMGRYELELNEWIKSTKYDVSANAYGGIPDEILLPYAAKDADATFRIFLIQFAELNAPGNEKIKELYENVVMPATAPILEIETTGMKVDTARLEFLAQKYTTKRLELTQRLQQLLNWPEFNPDSPVQKAAALFSWVKSGGKPPYPADATLRKFQPIKATNDKKWELVMQLDAKAYATYTPSTDRSVLQSLLLIHKDDEVLNALLLYTAIAQTVKTFTGAYVENMETGGHEVDGGILPKLWADGRVHTRIRQTVETGRYGHSDPNMAQLPKTAEDLANKAFKGSKDPIPSIRSCFMADPGHVLVDCDWTSAELFVMAWLSGDENMQRKLSDPAIDFHSEVALEMFRLERPPADYAKSMKDWLKETGNSKYRTIAKTITFGIAYGRGAAAIKDAVYMEGINITSEEAQQAVDKFKETFPQLATWLSEQQDKVSSLGYVENGLGRRRRFEPTNDKELISHQKRQAMNAPIQGTVGDLMSLALVNLYMIREAERPHLQYKILMSVHDQIILSCPIEQIEETLEVMRLAMCERCRIPGNDMMLGIDPEICIRWSEPLTDQDVAAYPALAKYKK